MRTARSSSGIFRQEIIIRKLLGNFDLQGEAGSVLGDGRYPVNCLGMNRSSLLAVGDCGGGLRIYHVQSASKVLLTTSIDLASIFAKKIQTDEVSLF